MIRSNPPVQDQANLKAKVRSNLDFDVGPIIADVPTAFLGNFPSIAWALCTPYSKVDVWQMVEFRCLEEVLNRTPDAPIQFKERVVIIAELLVGLVEMVKQNVSRRTGIDFRCGDRDVS